jgi:hypothetical protein
MKCFSLDNPSYLLEFVEHNSKKLSPKNYDEMVNYSMAHYYFLLGDYQKAIKCINDIKINYFFFRYDILNLELKIYYDKYNIEFIQRAIHNYKEMIKRDSFLTKYDKMRLNNFLKYYQKLIFLAEKISINKAYIQDISILYSTIQNESSFAMRKWLLQKISILLNKYNKKVNSDRNFT